MSTCRSPTNSFDRDDGALPELDKSFRDIPVIRQDWHESWAFLRETLQDLESRGVDPLKAVQGLLYVKGLEEDGASLDTASVEHFDNHLGTNYVPTPNERTQLRAFCSTGLQRLAALNAERARHVQHVWRTNSRRHALEELLSPYLALISPARTMPPEILQEIFLACLPTRHNPIMQSTQAPLLLGRVCSLWRKISISTPELWAPIHIVIPRGGTPWAQHEDSELHEVYCRGLREWMSRTGDHLPISISICAPLSLAIPQAFLDELLPYRHRWHVVYIVHAGPVQSTTLNPDEVPMLKSLEIHHTGWQDTGGLQFRGAPPILTSLTLKYVNGHIAIPTYQWDHLTTLCVETQSSFFLLSFTEAMELLSQCRRLQVCCLKFPYEQEAEGTAPTPDTTPNRITLSSLHSFELVAMLTSDATFNIAAVMNLLILPSLRTLKVQGAIPPNLAGVPDELSDMMLALDSLIKRSGCALETLKISQPVGDVGFFLQCLDRVPHLAELIIDQKQTTFRDLRLGIDPAPLLLALAERVESNSSHKTHHRREHHQLRYVPRLRRISLIYCDPTEKHHTLIAGLLHPRVRSGVLRSATISLKHPLASGTLGRLRSDGIVVGEPPVRETNAHALPVRDAEQRWEGIPVEEREVHGPGGRISG
ncbi:hypothetical protein FB45DRAFT_222488 [Roridomyces roridus]|uniref:F-box domain-containing protein n=1 Tax=Roridomyces roridus TaxID=1738132 RepID=A0AAD7BCP3_9AGAR|nr:hypothetical protein FB45DRAFT_222488 [Roridomyces roridus]